VETRTKPNHFGESNCRLSQTWPRFDPSGKSLSILMRRSVPEQKDVASYFELLEVHTGKTRRACGTPGAEVEPRVFSPDVPHDRDRREDGFAALVGHCNGARIMCLGTHPAESLTASFRTTANDSSRPG